MGRADTLSRGTQEDMYMRIFRLTAAIVAIALAGTVSAQGFPDYYPTEGFQRTGVLDALYPKDQRMVIGDRSFTYSSNVIVHSPKSYSVPLSRLTPGTRIGFKTLNNRGRVIIEIWLLPNDYKDGSRRR